MTVEEQRIEFAAKVAAARARDAAVTVPAGGRRCMMCGAPMMGKRAALREPPGWVECTRCDFWEDVTA